MEERLQKILAHAGVGSRRECEQLIIQGDVIVNGEGVRELGIKLDPDQCVIKVHGKVVRVQEQGMKYMLGIHFQNVTKDIKDKLLRDLFSNSIKHKGRR